MISRLITLAVSALILTSPAMACSLTPGTFIRSNFELIDAADAIVVARAVRGSKSERWGDIVFEVEETLKGSPTAEVIDRGGRFGDTIASDPNDILSANAEAFHGGCNRSTYKRGNLYVLMLGEFDEGGFIVAGDAFSRLSEDDFGPDSMWRRAIATYLEIQNNPDRLAQISALEDLLKRGSVETASAFEQQIAIDAAYHLQSIHPDKPTEWLLARYGDPQFMMRPLGAATVGTEEERIDKFLSGIFGDEPPLEDEKTAILRALFEGDHPEAEPLFRAIIAQTAPEPTQLGAALAFFVRQNEYALVRTAFGEHILWIEAITGPGSGPGFIQTMQRAIGYGDDLNVPPNFAEWWQRQKASLCFIKEGPVECSSWGEDEWDIATLLENPRENEVLLLASAHSAEVTDWAEAELDRLAADKVETHKDEWDFPMKLLLAAYNGSEPVRIHQLACGSKQMREGLADLIGEVPTYDTENLLREMMAIKQHKHVREQIIESAVLLAAHDMKDSRWGDADLATAYIRADDPLPLYDLNRRNLPCLE